MTMTRKKLIALIAAAAVVVGGGAVTAYAVSSHRAQTAALCADAEEALAAALGEAGAGLTAADAQLAAVTSTELPDSAGTSTAYAERAAVAAAPDRQGGAEFIADAEEARAGLEASTEAAPQSCETRDEASAATGQAHAVWAAAAALDEATLALADDFAAFQADEAKRIAAEKKAAEEAAAAEAARIAAEMAAASEAQYYDYGYDPGYGDGGSDWGGGAGGGGVGGSSGSGGGGGGGWTPPYIPPTECEATNSCIDNNI